MTIDLTKPGSLKALANSVLADIDAAAVELYEEGPRKHLGASVIGEECYRKIWYGFRWVKYKKHDGRQYRLFNRGHKEESRFSEWLTKAGYTVQELDPATGKQWRINGVMGHFGGSLDGVCWLPPKYEYTQPLLLEYKTNSTGQAFTKLVNNGCAIGKPQHFDQQSVYGFKMNLEYSVYLNVCKNDDNIYAEVIKLDFKRGADLEKKAVIVIEAEQPPKRISESKAAFSCKFCDFSPVCWDGVPYDRNCRSCSFIKPVENKEWYCRKWSAIVPDDVISVGCPQWNPAT